MRIINPKGEFMSDISVTSLLDLEHTVARELFLAHTYPWEVLPEIQRYITALIDRLPPEKYCYLQKDVAIAKSAKVAENVTVLGPTIIGDKCELRSGAFIRGGVLIGKGVTIGNSCEIKNSIIFDGAQIPHFNYVGDSIIGYRAHLGAGVITSNLKSDKSHVYVKRGEDNIPTGLKKFGAIIGDEAEIGCNAVLNPGAIVGRSSIVYPLSSVRGTVPARSILKTGGVVVRQKNI